MPSKNTVRNYYNGGYYHLYNRGVEKRNIFMEERDYLVFLYYLKVFLSDPDDIDKNHPSYDYRRKNYHGKLTLFAYCLMPNHYHLFVRQEEDNGVFQFMKALSNAYTEYFNKKNDRVGSLFQGKYKSAHVESEPHFLHLSRYIHLNPHDIGQDPFTYRYSSLKNYIDDEFLTPNWLQVDEIKGSIGSTKQYLDFINSDNNSLEVLGESAAIDN